MRSKPSANLVSLLGRLALATESELESVAPRVRRLAGNLPDFESVWVDALAQARGLTPFQAAEINAGRADALVCGPYVISHPLSNPHFAECFAARHNETRRAVRLYVVRHPQAPATKAARLLTQLVEQLDALRGSTACAAEDSGTTGEGVWAACPAVEGTIAAEWMVENGRFPPQVVCHIAREMLQRLSDLERLGVVHGDLGAAGLMLQRSGHVVLLMPGLRCIVRPSEGYSFDELQPEAYDYLAPERIAAGGPPTVESDLYACGCLWWHLLTGRPAFSGGNSLARLRAAHAAKTIDVRQLVPEVPEALASAIATCMAREPAARPPSMAQLSNQLGPPTRALASALAECLRRKSRPWHVADQRRTRRQTTGRRLPSTVATAVIIGLVALGFWPAWRRMQLPEPTDIVGSAATSIRLADAKALKPTAAASREAPGAGTGAAEREITLTTATSPVESDSSDDLILPSGETLNFAELELKSGRRVCGRSGRRPVVSVPEQGLVIGCEDVLFDGIDFIWQSDRTAARPAGVTAMIVVEAQAIEFRGCSFSTSANSPPCAVAWVGADDRSATGSGHLRFSDCVASGVAAVVDCQSDAPLALEMSNSLCLASGPILRLHRGPQGEESIRISLDHVTTRGDSAVLECRYTRLEDTSGPITITANDSALAGNPHGGLLVFNGAQHPDRLLQAITWNGQGSIVGGQTAMALWRSGPRRQQNLPDDELEIAGLVRSEVEFAGGAEGPPSASRVIRWQVPLRSADPPGANANSLFLPQP
jgi:serine/threonine-protein kinase